MSFSAYDRVTGTVSGQDFVATVLSVRHQHGKVLIRVLFDKPVNVVSGFVLEHTFLPADLRPLS
jgi:hypothetical protein